MRKDPGTPRDTDGRRAGGTGAGADSFRAVWPERPAIQTQALPCGLNLIVRVCSCGPRGHRAPGIAGSESRAHPLEKLSPIPRASDP